MEREIVFTPVIDGKDIERQLNSLDKKIKKATVTKEAATEAKLPLEKQLESLGQALDAAKMKLDEYKLRVSDAQQAISSPSSSAEDRAAAKGALKEDLAYLNQQKLEIEKIQKSWDKTKAKLDEYNAQIEESNRTIDEAKQSADGLVKQVQQIGTSSQISLDGVNKSFKSIESRLVSMIKRVMVWQIAMKALRSARTYITSLLAANKEVQSDLSALRGALATAFQPLYDAAIPALRTVLQLLTSIVRVVSTFLSGLFGKSAKQSAAAAEAAHKQAQEIAGVGSAAQKASKQLAYFDEINRMEAESSGGGGGGSGGVSIDFSAAGAELTDAEQRLGRILAAALAIGAALKLWSLSQKFDGALGLILKKFTGVMVTIAGALLAWDGFRSAIESGMDLTNLTEIVVGLLAIGGGISLITGGWIPLLIAAIASAVTALAYFTGHGDELISGLKDAFGGLAEFVKGAFTGDWGTAIEGLEKSWQGFQTVIIAILDSLGDGFATLIDWLDKLTNSDFEPIFDGLKSAFYGLIDFLEAIVTGEVFTLEYWQGIFSVISTALGLDEFVPRLQSTWEAIKKWWKENVAPIFTVQWWVSQFSAIGEGLKETFKNGINAVIEMLNTFIGWVNSKLTFTIPSVDFGFLGSIPGGTFNLVSIPQIPMLAQGAVIPPNAPFMAMLGDQRSGTNLEAPESLIRKIVREEAGTQSNELLEQLLQAVLSIKIGDETIAKAANRGNRAFDRAYGR